MVGIIPKPIKKTSKLSEFIPHISFGLVIAVVLGYVVLFYFENKASISLRDLEDRIAQVGTPDEKNTEMQVLLDKKRIDDFSKLLESHKISSDFFKFLEENCHPKIWFAKLSLDPQKFQVSLSGATLNFQTLEQQIIIFKNHELVKNVDLAGLSIGKKGEVEFSLSLDLDPKVFDFDSNGE